MHSDAKDLLKREKELNKISIIVPVYQVEQELARCVQSLLVQTWHNIEVILVDDGSPDNCPRLCDEFARQDSRVKVIHKQNEGLSSARNTGLREATGDYILYVDSDDYIAPDSCEQLLEGVAEGVDFVVGAYNEICGTKTTCNRHTNINPKMIYTSKEFTIASIKNNEWYSQAWLNLYNRIFLTEHKLYYKNGYLFEDHQMLPRLYLAAKNVVYIDYPFYNYVIRENSIMTSANSLEKVKMSLDIYGEWRLIISAVKDKRYQRYLYGILVRFYLRNCRVRKIKGWQIKEINFGFALRYALGFRERIKVIFYAISPEKFWQ